MLANSLYPKADPGFGHVEKQVTLPIRPQTVGPIFDAVSSREPLADYDAAIHEQSYGSGAEVSSDGLSNKAPRKPEGFVDPYLYPMLTRNERARLTMLWYYTRDLIGDTETMQKMQTKVDLLQSLIGWEFAICGLLENDVFERIATVGLPLAVLPRRESTCSHTVQQAAGSVFFIPNMSNDWRFSQSPRVSQGGIRTYAGAQLSFQSNDGQSVALGSLCIASSTPDQVLGQSQTELLVKFADMLTEDIVNGSRRKRAKQQQQNDVLLREAYAASMDSLTEEAVTKILDQVFPDAQTSILPIKGQIIRLVADAPDIALPDLTAKSAMWEDGDLIDGLLHTNNHKKLDAARPVRAMIGIVSEEPSSIALVVSTSDVTHIFDDIDVRFVEGCATILRSVAQEKSLQDALRARERFIRGITHQLRTPIHGILASVDLVAEEIARPQQIERLNSSMNDVVPQSLRMIRSSGRELMSTVNNVIKFNQWTESVSTSEMATLSDLNKLESEILDNVSWLLHEEHLGHISIFFHNKLPTDANAVQIDLMLIKDCVESLVLNALQNIEHGCVVITISAPLDHSSIIFDVQDTGCGIALADQCRVFDAYEKGNNHSTGAGLGLTLARKISEAMSGTVSLMSSVLGEGSHFRAEIPNPVCASLEKSIGVAVTPVNDVPAQFVVIPSSPSSMLDEHFARYLETRGMRSSEDVANAVAIVSFTHVHDRYQERLRMAANSLLTVSLVPAGQDLSDLEGSHPRVLFFSSPFTSTRLTEILLEIRHIFLTRIPPPVPSQVSSSEIDNRGPRLPQPSSNLSSRRTSLAVHSSDLNCLLVDDNLINLRIMRMYCEKRKFPHETAVDGLEAIDKYKCAVKKTPISLILLDLQMPKCDGIQACEEIRAFEAQMQLPPAAIFIITGQDSPTDRARSFAAGADKFFVKPLALKSLDRGIAEMFVTTT